MPLSEKCFPPTEIQDGLIGVGLINVEDISGAMSLDKGDRCLPLKKKKGSYSSNVINQSVKVEMQKKEIK